MTREEHRGKGNHGANHPNRGPSKVDHGPEWGKKRKEYWKQKEQSRLEDAKLPFIAFHKRQLGLRQSNVLKQKSDCEKSQVETSKVTQMARVAFKKVA